MDPTESTDYELSRGALRALAMAVSTDKSRPDLAHVQLAGDHEGRATNGHLVAYLQRAADLGPPRAVAEGEAIYVPAEEVGRLKSEASRRADIAHVVQCGTTLRVTVPTGVQVDGEGDMRTRVDVLADSYEAAAYPDTANPDICAPLQGRVWAHVSAEYLGTVAAMAAALGCTRVEIRRNGSDPQSPIAFLMEPPGPPSGPLERFAVVVMPQRGDTVEPEARPDPQAAIPGCEPRPSSLVELPRQRALALVAECRSAATLARWREEELARGPDHRPSVAAALELRLREVAP